MDGDVLLDLEKPANLTRHLPRTPEGRVWYVPSGVVLGLNSELCVFFWGFERFLYLILIPNQCFVRWFLFVVFCFGRGLGSGRWVGWFRGRVSDERVVERDMNMNHCFFVGVLAFCCVCLA